jgi:parvulin-like peptidyl-prolyl isomerase
MKKSLVGLVMTLFFTGNALATTEVVDKKPKVVEVVAKKSKAPEVVDKTLAVVNGESILASKFNYVFSQIKQGMPAESQTVQKENELRDIVLDRLVMDVVIKQEAKKQKIQVSKKEIQDEINKMKGSVLAARLKETNETMADFKKNVSDEMIIDKFNRQHLPKYLQSEVKIPSEIETKSLYDKVIIKMKGGKTNFSKEEDEVAQELTKKISRDSQEHVRIRQILISCPKDAPATKVKQARDKTAVVKKELRKQEFEDVAKQYSEDEVSKSRGGDIGEVIGEDFHNDAVSKTAFSIKVGDYTKEPIRTDDGWYFLKVEEKKAKKNVTFATVKNHITGQLYQVRLAQALEKYFDNLKSKATIKINKTW